jgi:catechol 2,3-dioxygenase-like lactoylglutathione lyase family enzyme
MEPRISIITLGVRDLERSLRFYRDGLGLPTTRHAEQGIVFFQTAGTCLALYPYDELARDVGPEFADASARAKPKFAGITLAHNVARKEDVDRLLLAAQRAGAKIEKPASETEWGGYSGYFSDPDGHLWEIAWGAFKLRDDGSLIID